MKILFVNDFLEVKGGAEVYIHTLAKALKENGIEIITFTTKPSTQFKIPSYIKKAYFTQTYKLDTKDFALSRLWNIHAKRKIKEIIKKERPHLIHFHNVLARLSPSVIYEAQKHVPVLITIHDTRFDCATFMKLHTKKQQICDHNFGFKCLTSGCIDMKLFIYQFLRNFLFRKSIKKADILISPSTFVKKVLERMKNKKVIVITNCIDIKLFESTKNNVEGNNRILFVGRIEKYKGLQYLLTAIKKVTFYYPQVKLIVAGEGNDEHLMKKITKELDIEKNVKFLGKVDHDKLISLYKQVDIVCIPSLADNSPLTVYEGMGAGKIVIASKVGGIPDLIEHNITGFLFTPKEPKLLSDIIIRVLSNKDLMKKIRENAKTKARRDFDIEPHINKILSIYKILQNA